jgi:hypothetical protein
MKCAVLNFILVGTLLFAARGPRYTTSNGHEMPKPFVEVKNGTYHGSGPREEARAMCSIKTLEVNATASAAITRRLHGVVTSSKETPQTGQTFLFS